ncbi:DNA-binding transcriptional LysR family regulator [Kribbella voronezhensis]|uniref:DNA-binding transcriptional LysR family regulator n=1 Tax=Kribbella voronezhensis TaxID=2512212 RepID=A0A4R7SY48_9ACTN|nr:LysR substrate-binding domain-containing protein [Kribbella voronezhensis]TDU84302.1 DNA-binding transcriptional LysR family regulator [Kribbella voronezhensis]
MDLSLQQLKGFVAVAEEQHFGRAAERLSMTQPPLTRQIQGLERSLAVSLFDRTGRGVRLTAAGTVFLEHCRRMLALLEIAPEATRRAADGQTGTLRIAFTAIGAYAVLADFLTTVGKRTPAVTSELTELVSADQFEALAGLKIDIGLVRPPIPEQFESLLVHSEDLVLAVPAAHPLALGDGPASLAEVTDDYIGYSPEGSRYLHDICAAMIGMNRYAVSQLASQVPTMLALVRAGLGCALIPRSIMAMGVQGVRYRELDAADAHSVTLHACWSPDNPNPALQRLVESLLRNPHLDASPSGD